MKWLLGTGIRGALIGLCGALLTACAYRGDIDTPVTVEVTWYSYINGDDLRADCRPGAPTRYRLIYNADFEKQLRIYEIFGLSGGTGWMVARVQGENAIGFRNMLFGNPLSPGNWIRSENTVTAESYSALEDALASSGAFEAPPTGLRVYSDQYYWVVTSCRDGVFAFNVWRYPSERYEALAFPELLFAEERSGIAIAPPQEVSPAARMKGAPKGQSPNSIFELYVGEAGFEGHIKI